MDSCRLRPRNVFRTAIALCCVFMLARTDGMAQNFVAAQSEYVQIAERSRLQSARFWTGQPLPGTWSAPCPIRVHRVNAQGVGRTTFTFENGEVFGWRMEVSGTDEELRRDVIPHEVDHAVRASLLRRPLERWLDEGAAAVMESAASHQRLRELTRKSLTVPTPITDDWLDGQSYPANANELASVYSLGFSIVEFLLDQRGPGALLHFQRDPRPPSRKLRDHYGFDVAALNRSWREWFVARCRLGCDCQAFGCPMHRTESPSPRPHQGSDSRTIRVWTASWCGPCQQFWRDVREDELFRTRLAKWGRIVAVDVDRAAPQAREKGIRKLPTFEFAEGRIEGYDGKSKLLEQLAGCIRLDTGAATKPTEGDEMGSKPPETTSDAAAEPPQSEMNPGPVPAPVRDSAGPPPMTATRTSPGTAGDATGFLLSLVELATVVGASAATGGAGGLALTLGASFVRRWWRRRRISRGPPDGVPSETPSATTDEGREDGTQAPFPRQLDEARELLELRKSERRVAVLDALRGMFFDDAYEHTFLSADDRERAVLKKLRAEVDARVDEVAPLSTTVE